MAKHASASRPHGYSLLEFIITAAISAILVAAAIPSFSYFKARSDAKVVTSTLSRALAKARSHAIFHSKLVTLCGTNDGLRCSRSQFKRIIIFIDSNDNRTLDNEETLVSETTLDYQGQLQLRASLGRQYLQFTRSGHSRQAGSFIYCDADHINASRRVTISLTGRSYIAADEDNDGTVELANGEPISCS